ncbi:MAG: hypothetical protein ABI353_07235 [Isosphaeraceae bacterium]
MTLAKLVVLVLLGAGGEPDAQVLVQQLGSTRYAQREDAAKALEVQGRLALPSLRVARESRDPEVRTRAAALVERIESSLLVRPTLVRLNYRDRLLAEVVKDLADQSQIPLSLFPENNPLWTSKRITLQESDPVPFWKALDLIGQQAQIQPMQVGGRGNALNLVPGNGHLALPTSDSGPFRTRLQGINHDRHRTFDMAQAPVLFGGQPQAAPPGLPAIGNVPGHATDNFYFNIQLLVEPRMNLSQPGTVKLTEAVDDKGQSLLPPAASTTSARHSGFNGYTPGGQTNLTMICPLRFPDQPGTTITRLRGVVPLIVSARKDDPTTISLADAKGKSFEAGELTLIVNDMRVEPNNPQVTILDLTLRLGSAQGDQGQNRAAINALAFHTPNTPNGQFEILDAQGKSYPQWMPMSQQFGTVESRLVLSLPPQAGLGAPAQIRVYDTMRVNTEATFEFQNIPMP